MGDAFCLHAGREERLLMAKTVLIVEDDRNIADLLRLYLEKEGYTVVIAPDGMRGVEQFRTVHPSLVLLDVMLPKLNGFEVCQAIREFSEMPIIMLTAKGDDMDKILGLDYGADDYITKPFGGGELLARVRAALRHARNQVAGPSYTQTGVYRAGELCIDFDRHLVQLEGQDVHLTQSEYKIVSLLTRYAGKVLTYDFIIREIWGEKATGDTQNLRANMAKIRRKLEKNPGKPQYIFTEVGVGSRMAEGE